MSHLKIPKGYKLMDVTVRKRFRRYTIDVTLDPDVGWEVNVQGPTGWRGLACGMESIEEADELGRDLVNDHIKLSKLAPAFL